MLARRSSTSGLNRTRVLPLLRLPTTVFPTHTISLCVDEPDDDVRRFGTLSLPVMHEAWHHHAGKLATLAWGQSVGVELQLLDDSRRDGCFPTPPNVVHAVGGRRLQLLEMLEERSPAGGRLGLVAPLDDDDASVSDAARLRREAEEARRLLLGSPTPIALTLCTEDEELGLGVCDPRAHPLWREKAQSHGAPPDDDAALSLWLAARLSLTTALRAHLLACTDPHKRMRDCVDALRLLADPRRARSPDAYASFTVVWDTAESGGCELAPPVPTVDWAKHAHK